METIFTLLIIILPIVFKFIGKKLEQAAGPQQQTVHQSDDASGPVQDWAEVLRRHLEQQQAVQEQTVEAEPVPAPVQTLKTTVEKHTRPAVKPSSPILLEQQEIEREKIDKKKLIVYSEIMTPKYKE